MFPTLRLLIKQLFERPFTNKFPVKYAPKNVTALLQRVGKGEVEIHPPIGIPDVFRGKIVYEKDKCIGCKMCIRVCPAKAIDFKEEEKKIRIYIGRCVFCSQCNDVCPVQCLYMSDEFLLADTNRLGDGLIVE
jgi:formate hydrogenlyase subunit 6/NADH:ubiquinone oxidoreductase subunit I